MHHLRHSLTQCWQFAHNAPATLCILVSILATGIATGSFTQSALHGNTADLYGYGLPTLMTGPWWAIFSGLLVAPEPWMYLALLPLLVIVCGYLEIRYGWIRMLASFFIPHIVSVVLAAGLFYIAAQFLHLAWAKELIHVKDVGMSNATLGALGVVTASLPLFWRFRIRFFGILLGCALVLYSGLVWDFTHLFGFITGIAIGPYVISRQYTRPAHWFDDVDVRLLSAGLLVFYALSYIIPQLHPGNGGILEHGHTATHPYGIHLIGIVVSFVLLWFAYGLYMGRAVAWRTSLIGASILCVIEILQLTHHISANHIFNTLLSFVFIATLLRYKSSFSAPADPRTRRNIYLRLVAVAACIATLHVVVLYSLRHSFSPEPSMGEIVTESLYQTVNVTTGEFIARSTLAGFALNAINYVWLGFILVSLVALLLTTRRGEGNGDKALYIELLKQWGGSTLAWMGTWQHIRYHTNTSRTAILAYRLSGSVAIVLGDPVGELRTTKKLVEDFDQYCHVRGWTVAYFSSSQKTTKLLKPLHYTSVHVASDTLVALDDLSFTGKPWQSVRSAINKAAKNNVTMQTIRYSEVPLALRDQLLSIEHSWSDDKALPEMGFTLGTLREAEDTEVRMHIAVDQDGTVHGMTSWLPVYAENGQITGWTLDIMQRRLADITTPGVIEFLIAETARSLKQEGYTFISLSGAPLSGLADSTDIVERALNWASVKFEPYYGFASLHKFKQKFQPTEAPMYLCYKDPDQLAAIGIALARAYMGDASLADIAKSVIRP